MHRTLVLTAARGQVQLDSVATREPVLITAVIGLDAESETLVVRQRGSQIAHGNNRRNINKPSARHSHSLDI